MEINQEPHATDAKGAKGANIRRPKRAGVFYLGGLGGLGVRHSDRIPHATGAKGAKGGGIWGPKRATASSIGGSNCLGGLGGFGAEIIPRPCRSLIEQAIVREPTS